MSVKVTNQNTPTATTDQLLIVEAFDGTPTPNGRLRQGVYYSFQNTWRNFTEKLGLDKIFVPIIRTITINGTTKSLEQNIDFTVSGGVSDGDKGDITVSGSGATWTINNDAVTNDKIDSVDATKVNEDTTHRFVTDTEKSTWNGKQNALGYTPEDVANKTTNINGAAGTYPDTPTVKNYVDGLFVQTIPYKRSLLTFTGTTNERALDIIPLDVNSFDYLYRFFVWARMSAATGTIRVRIGTYAAPIDGAVGANSIGQQTLLGSFALTSNNRSPFVRNINIVGGSSGSAVSMVAAVLSDELQVATSTSVAIDTTTQLYMYVSVTLNSAALTYTSDSIVVTKTKLT